MYAVVVVVVVVPTMKKYKEGMKIHYAEKGVVVNTILDCPAEHQYIDELEEDDLYLYPDPPGYDMTDPNHTSKICT